MKISLHPTLNFYAIKVVKMLYINFAGILKIEIKCLFNDKIFRANQILFKIVTLTRVSCEEEVWCFDLIILFKRLYG